MKNKGFTLLELIVVLIVMAALVAIALPQYTAFVERSRAAEAIQSISAIRTAEEARFIMTNAYIACNPGEYANVLGIAIPEDNWQYTTTALGPGGRAGYYITARRQNTLNCPVDIVNSIIEFIKSTSGITWKGTHPGAPQQTP